MEAHPTAIQASINGVGKILREAAPTKPAEFIAQVRYALGTIELYFGTPEGTSMNIPTGKVVRAYMRVLLSQLEYIREAHASGLAAPLPEDQRSEIGELIDHADEIIDSLAWVADEELNTQLRAAASRAAT